MAAKDCLLQLSLCVEHLTVANDEQLTVDDHLLCLNSNIGVVDTRKNREGDVQSVGSECPCQSVFAGYVSLKNHIVTVSGNILSTGELAMIAVAVRTPVATVQDNLELIVARFKIQCAGSSLFVVSEDKYYFSSPVVPSSLGGK